MFPKFKKIDNESGIVLFIVLMTSIVIMIYSLGILTQSVNEINYAQQQIDQITHAQETQGVFWKNYANGMQGISTTTDTLAATNLSGRQQNQTINLSSSGTINKYTVTASSDTFQ